jgi:hypothetical protein
MKDKKPANKAAAEAATLVILEDRTAKSGKAAIAKAKKSETKKPATESAAPDKAKDKKAKGDKKALNFKVSSDFRREFKTYASAHEMKLNKLLEVAFESLRKQNGD